MNTNLVINKSILSQLEEASSLLCGYLDYMALAEDDITMGGDIERALNGAISRIKGGANENSGRATETGDRH